MRNIASLFRRFRDDERGVFAVFFGLFAIVLIAAAGCVVDYTSIELARTKAQQALDAAALGLAPKIYDAGVTEEDMRARAEAIVTERMADSQVAVEVTQAGIDTADGSLRFAGRITVPMAFMQLLGIRTISANVASEATKGSVNYEVALAIDLTQSMSGSKITALQSATSSLIDIIVKDDQTASYSRMAIVPYSMGVNVGGYASAVRGTPRGPTDISGAAWSNGSGSISGISRTSPYEVTSANHGLRNGDRIYISGVGGMTQVNNTAFRVSVTTANTFALQRLSDGRAINTSNYSKYTSGGTWKKCLASNCEVVVSSAGHGISENDYVQITGVQGMTGINNSGSSSWRAISVETGKLTLEGSFGPDYSAYSRGGKLQCLTNDPAGTGCQKLRYTSVSGSAKISTITTCVTERTDPDYVYTNAPPTDAWMGRHYPDNTTNSCLGNRIVPLTDQKGELHDQTATLNVSGSTAGHIGLAWAWYMLSPSFGSLWASAEDHIYAPADPSVEGTEPVAKFVVLMTDGQFNTAYCKGVVSMDSDSLAGSNSERRNCNAPDDSTTQAETLCDAIKANDIEIYTVAFALTDIRDDDEREAAEDLMANCATDARHAYLANNADDLSQAFADIGRNITDLRLSR